MSVRRVKHPRLRRTLPLFISQQSITLIVVIYLVSSFLLSVLLAVGVHYTHPDRPSMAASLRMTISGIYSLRDMLDPADSGEGYAYLLIAWLTETLGLLLPVFLLGAFIFRLFQQNPIVWRKNISVLDFRNLGPTLAIRFYNGTADTLVNVRLRVDARQVSQEPSRVRLIQHLKLYTTTEMVDEVIWSMGLPGVPFTVWVPLDSTLPCTQIAQGKGVQLQGPIISRRDVELLVVATGNAISTGESFTSMARYYLGDDVIQDGHPQDINIDRSFETPAIGRNLIRRRFLRPFRRERGWGHWDHFEDVQPLFVFGYGSLVDPSSAAQTFGYEMFDEKGPISATLLGWSRAWNVPSGKHSHPERRLIDVASGQEFLGVMVALGIEKDAESQCRGVVYSVSNRDLWLLDSRERNYERVDVSDSVEWVGKPEGCQVLTYRPRKEIAEILKSAVENEQAVIRSSYYRDVRQAFDALGGDALAEFDRSTRASDLPIAI